MLIEKMSRKEPVKVYGLRGHFGNRMVRNKSSHRLKGRITNVDEGIF
jgi:hypothetical protein